MKVKLAVVSTLCAYVTAGRPRANRQVTDRSLPFPPTPSASIAGPTFRNRSIGRVCDKSHLPKMRQTS